MKSHKWDSTLFFKMEINANRGKGNKFLLRLACLFELWDYKSEAEPRGSMTATSYGNNFCFQFLQHRLIALLRILSIFWEGGWTACR